MEQQINLLDKFLDQTKSEIFKTLDGLITAKQLIVKPYSVRVGSHKGRALVEDRFTLKFIGEDYLEESDQAVGSAARKDMRNRQLYEDFLEINAGAYTTRRIGVARLARKYKLTSGRTMSIIIREERRKRANRMKFLSNSKLERNIAIYNEFVELNRKTKIGEKKRGWTFLSRKYKISPERVRMILTQLNNRIEAGDLQLNDDFKIIKFKHPRDLI